MPSFDSPKNGSYDCRLSNGGIESLNRIPKDMKRSGRGYANFEHMRNRFLFSQRKNAAMLSSPKDLALVQAKRIYPTKN
ncbi:MAG: transposase [Firmicutes bacterium]|nr:transposase [Bacillota bacterium]